MVDCGDISCVKSYCGTSRCSNRSGSGSAEVLARVEAQRVGLMVAGLVGQVVACQTSYCDEGMAVIMIWQ